MVDVLLFHHALGLTPGIEAFAEKLRAAGHTVTVPDLFEGHIFDDLDSGLGYAGQTGFGEIAERGVREADDLPENLVYIGYSLGVMPAQQLAQTRPGARGAVFISSFVPVSEFGDGWPAGVPVQVHGMDADSIFVDEGDLEAANDLVANSADAELFLYQGNAHFFADSSVPTYDETASSLLTERILAFLARV